jgi:hypothetical protein
MRSNSTTQAAEQTRSIVLQRLARCYSSDEHDWSGFYQPRQERANLATRYHLVYPALAYYILLKQQPERRGALRPQLNAIYRRLLTPRCWSYWHSELQEETWPLQERNLTYAGRLATFVGLYIDAFGEPPADRIELDGRSISYSGLSESLWRQGLASPNHGVSCYHHQSMVMCNAHLLINNVLHDRLFGTNYAEANEGWLKTLDQHLLRKSESGPLFYYGTKPSDIAPEERTISRGADVWALFLMSAVIPERVTNWFTRWQGNITHAEGTARVEVTTAEAEREFSSDLLATSWAFCLAKELGDVQLAGALRNTLRSGAEEGFNLDPLLSGLFLLGDSLTPGSFRALIGNPPSAVHDQGISQVVK